VEGAPRPARSTHPPVGPGWTRCPAKTSSSQRTRVFAPPGRRRAARALLSNWQPYACRPGTSRASLLCCGVDWRFCRQMRCPRATPLSAAFYARSIPPLFNVSTPLMCRGVAPLARANSDPVSQQHCRHLRQDRSLTRGRHAALPQLRTRPADGLGLCFHLPCARSALFAPPRSVVSICSAPGPPGSAAACPYARTGPFRTTECAWACVWASREPLGREEALLSRGIGGEVVLKISVLCAPEISKRYHAGAGAKLLARRHARP
jgi:hypothetical protein